jgi:XTP/dITP diphosphohydrolase
MSLIFVTSNRHKFEEISEIAADRGIKIEMKDLPCEEIQADKIEEVASKSAVDACTLLGKPCFVEDAGLFVSSLRGFPGPYSSYVFRTIGNDGLLRLMARAKNRRAEFRSAISYCEPNSEATTLTGRAVGKIALKSRGSHGFGFDPIFIPGNSDGKTFGEMTIAEKGAISHRARAGKKFLKWYTIMKKAQR